MISKLEHLEPVYRCLEFTLKCVKKYKWFEGLIAYVIKQVSDMLIVGGCTDVCCEILSTFMFDNFHGKMLGEGAQKMKPKHFIFSRVD